VANVALFQSRDTDLFGYAANGFFKRQIHVIAQVRRALRAGDRVRRQRYRRKHRQRYR
jgi:hypothetical protein